MNSWNNKQCILIQGELDINDTIEKMVQILHDSDIIPKVQLQKYNPNESNNEQIIKAYVPEGSLKQEEREVYDQLIEKAMQNNMKFNYIIQRFVVPVKFSFLALVSARKATIFSDNLIDLMIHVAKRTFDGLNICLNEKAFE